MMSDIEKALNIFNNITGKTELSCQYKQMLDSFNISESNGYIVKLKLTDEILSGKLNSNEVETRLNMILNRLSKFKSSYKASGTVCTKFDKDGTNIFK